MPSMDAAFSEMVREIKEEVRSAVRAELAQARPSASGDSLTVEDIARSERVHPETVRQWCRSKRLKHHFAGRHYRVRPDDLAAFLAKGACKAPTKSAEEIAAAFLNRKRGG